jgi:anti-sigma B factor antagonist
LIHQDAMPAPRTVVVTLPGEIDIRNEGPVQAALAGALAGRPKVVVADGTGTGFCDSAAITALISAHHYAATAGAQLRLVLPSAAVRRVLELTDADQVLRVYLSLQNAYADGSAGSAPHHQSASSAPRQMAVSPSVPKAPMTAEGLYPDADWLRISPLSGCTGLRLNGEADMHTAEALRKALAELPPDASEIHLQLAGLEFIDVAAARHLAALAIRLSRPTVILHYPPPPLILLLRLLWPDSLDRFRVCGERADPETRSDLAAHQASGHRDNVV